MGNENNSFTHAFLDPQQLKLQIVFDQRIKRRKSFIHQKYIRIISKRPGYTYTLFHPAGQAAEFFVLITRQSDHIDHFHSLIFTFFFADTAYF